MKPALFCSALLFALAACDPVQEPVHATRGLEEATVRVHPFEPARYEDNRQASSSWQVASGARHGAPAKWADGDVYLPPLKGLHDDRTLCLLGHEVMIHGLLGASHGPAEICGGCRG